MAQRQAELPSNYMMMSHLKQLKTSELSALMRKDLDTKILCSIESFPNSWHKEETSPISMAQEANPFSVELSKIKTSN
jgi:hypothetical protein